MLRSKLEKASISRQNPILNGGPARLDRIDLPTVSMQLMAPGLTLVDVDMTLGLIPVAAANIIKFLPKRFFEPALPAYAAAESAALPPADPLTAEQQAIVEQSKKQAGDTAQPAVVDPSLTAAAALGQSATAQQTRRWVLLLSRQATKLSSLLLLPSTASPQAKPAVLGLISAPLLYMY